MAAIGISTPVTNIDVTEVPAKAFIRNLQSLRKALEEDTISAACEKELQLKACQLTHLGIETFIAARTGFGKSICMLLPYVVALERRPNVYMIYCSPLLSLNEDFVNKCRSYGLTVTVLTPNTPDDDFDTECAKILKGEYNVVVTTPELLVTNKGKVLLKYVNHEQFVSVCY